MKKTSFIACILALAALCAEAQTATNVTAGFDPFKRVVEPATIAQNYLGGEWYVTAFMDTTPQINASFKNGVGGSWSMPQPLPLSNPFDRLYDTKSGDPVLVENQTDTGVAPRRIYAVGTGFSGGAAAFVDGYCTHFNGINIWWSDNGGQSWYYPFRVHRNDFGEGYFDDKPWALVSKAPQTAGLVYVAFVRVRQPCAGVPTTTIYFYRYNSATWSSTYLSAPATGPLVTNPIIFENPTTGVLGLAWMNFNNAPNYSIDVTTSNNGGVTWEPVQSYPDPNLMRPGSYVCSESADPRAPGQCVGASIGLMGRFNPVTGAYGLVWHHRTGTNGAAAMFATFTPGSGFSNAVSISPNLGSHYTWNAAVDVDSSGNYFMTYYDYDHGVHPTLFSYFLSGTKRSPSGLFLADSQIFDNAVASDPSIYGPTAEVGEYKDVFYWNGVFNAVTVYMKNGRDDIFHIRVTP